MVCGNVKYDNKVYTRVNKVKARRLANEGETIVITPCKANPQVGMFSAFYTQNNECNVNLNTFDKFVNCFEYYSCNNQFGKYANYYIQVRNVGMLR